jgi:Na+-driven multidrug efflux pump
LTYSSWVFSAAVLIWLFNSLAAVIRGTGNMAVPAWVGCIGAAMLVPASPILIFGWGSVPAFGIAGGAMALVGYYALGCIALAAYLWSGRGVLRPTLRGIRFRAPLFRDILRVGLVAALVTLSTNLTIMVGTALVGRFGPEAIAGYGTAARLEYLLVPLVFGLGGPLVAMVATSIGAAIATAVTEAIGLTASAYPLGWLSLFGSDPAMLDAGSRYLHVVGPFYGMIGLALSLYFASQGAGRLLWPLLANVTRLAIAAVGGWLALRWSGEMSLVFFAQSAALVAFGLINAGAIMGGSWFGTPSWRRIASRFKRT